MGQKYNKKPALNTRNASAKHRTAVQHGFHHSGVKIKFKQTLNDCLRTFIRGNSERPSAALTAEYAVLHSIRQS